MLHFPKGSLRERGQKNKLQMLSQESLLDWPVDSTRTKTRRLQYLLLGDRRLQSLLLLGDINFIYKFALLWGEAQKKNSL